MWLVGCPGRAWALPAPGDTTFLMRMHSLLANPDLSRIVFPHLRFGLATTRLDARSGVPGTSAKSVNGRPVGVRR